MKKAMHIMYVLSFLAIIFGVALLSIFKADRESSEFENRTLALRPDLTKQSLLSGEYTKAFEKYFADQLFGRDQMIEIYTREQLLMKKSIVNGIVVSKENWLLNQPAGAERFHEIDESHANLQKLTDQFIDKDVEFYFAAAPNKTSVLTSLYPAFIETNYTLANQKYLMEHMPPSVHRIDLLKDFKESYSEEELEEMYFRTDHHWNIEGAFRGYQKIIQEMDKQSKIFKGTPIKKDELELVCNQESSFIGSHNRQLYLLESDAREKVCYYEPYFSQEYGSVSAKTWDGQTLDDIQDIYNTDFRKEPIQYGHIFTWDLPEIHFEYKNTGNDLHLLVLKDSYGNPIQPFLAQHFNKTSILDIRHYKEKSIAQYIDDRNIDLVLFVYNDSNVAGEMYDFFADK